MRWVLDTDVLVAAIRSDAGASHMLLKAALEKRFSLLLSVPLLIEYEAVMTRPQHLSSSGLSAGDVGLLLDTLALVAVQVRLAFLWRPALKDANDDMVLETAMNGQADAIVTFNQQDFCSATKRFKLTLLSPGDAVRQLEKRQ
ncbi:MAG: putative toxin-antitoxin system toxin component, PIN family [Alphaproteobacteria bacterium]|nr:putative toxin-antitoxin system toxin component, PIN family [Alphaproteobacteria bacterium]